jgi:nucleotidyltransferase substrate binding protein (TIGR01987 family)
MNKKEIRWQQRFQNFEKAFQLLERTVNIKSLSEAERGGLIQFFEVAFELSWKTMKDYLEAQGFLVKTPREVIRQAFQIELIGNGQTWLQALEDRNLTTHTYDEETAMQIEQVIKEKYFLVMKDFYDKLKTEARP